MHLCPELRGLAEEHARWRRKLAERSGDGPRKRATWILRLWEDEILPHCRVEEDVLLPELSRRLSEADALLVFALGDHLALRRLAKDLKDASPSLEAKALAEFEFRLEEHLSYEDRTLFPGLQEALGCELLARLEPGLSPRGRLSPRNRPRRTS